MFQLPLPLQSHHKIQNLRQGFTLREFDQESKATRF